MRIAFSYVRFSTREQANSDSLHRQRKSAEEYAARHGLTLDTSYVDPGFSAHKGRHIVKGALGRFVKAVEEHRIPAKAVLLIEAFDRLSRQDALSAMTLFTALMRADITVVTLEDGQVYTEERVTDGETQLVVAVIKMQAAYEYSKRLAVRVRSAWESKRDTLPSRKLTKWGPAWLRYDPNTDKFYEIPERVAVVWRIFNLYCAGLGKELITRTLNRDEEPAWEAIGNRKQAAGWHTSYVARILKSRAVLGEFQAGVTAEVEGRRKTTKVGEIEAGYFPPVISRAVWDRAEAIRATRTQTGGPKSSGVHNLFNGRMTCAECGGPVVFRAKGDRRSDSKTRRTPYPSWRLGHYFVCSNAVREARSASGVFCEDKSLMPVAPFEDAVLNGFAGMLFDRELPVDPVLTEMQGRADRLSTEIEAKRANLDAAIAQFAASPEVMASVARIEKSLAADTSALDDLRRQITQRRGRLTAPQIIDALTRLRADAGSPDLGVRVPARLQIAEALKSIVDTIVVSLEDRLGVVTYGGFYELLIHNDTFYGLPVDGEKMLREARSLDRADPRFERFRTLTRRATIVEKDGRVNLSWTKIQE